MYNSMNPESSQILMPIIFTYVAFFSFFAILGIINYILRGIAIYKMSANRGIANGWLGFIPFAHNYQFGRISGEIEFGSKKIKNTPLWLLLAPIIYGFIFVIGYAAVLLPYIFKIISSSSGDTESPQEFLGMFPVFFFSILIFVLVMMVVQVFVYLIKYLALHKVFSQYSTGQRPVFYLIISLVIPLAQAILLFMHRNRPLLETKAALPSENDGMAE